jgi:hypothetical protein
MIIIASPEGAPYYLALRGLDAYSACVPVARATGYLIAPLQGFHGLFNQLLRKYPAHHAAIFV